MLVSNSKVIVVFIRIATSCTVIIPCVRRCGKEALKEAGDLRGGADHLPCLLR